MKPCIFPFKFNGETYNKCTDVNDPDDRLWCSTKIDDSGNHVQSGGFWGHCGQDCNIDTDHQAELSFSSFSQGKNILCFNKLTINMNQQLKYKFGKRKKPLKI